MPDVDATKGTATDFWVSLRTISVVFKEIAVESELKRTRMIDDGLTILAATANVEWFPFSTVTLPVAGKIWMQGQTMAVAEVTVEVRERTPTV